MQGAMVCYHHGGAAPQVKAKAAERVLEMRLAGELRKLGWDSVSDPLDALQSIAGEVLAWLTLCREQLAKIDVLDYSDDKGAQDVRPVVALYERALDRAERTLARMLQLGIQDRVARSVELTAEANIEAFRLLIRSARESDTSEEELILTMLSA